MDARRTDLDWLRIAAFGTLILYHVGMFYVTWDWHVKSSRASDAIEPLMMLTNPWRLTLLFIISGAATRFMADKMSAGALTASRMGRLWPPLLLAVFVIVPPQSYCEIVEALRAMPAEQAASYAGALDNFWVKYATASGNWCDADGCLTTPTYNHMWFVAYLILYTLALIALLPLLRRAPSALARLVSGPFLFITPWLLLFVLRVTLFPVFGETHDFRADWYLHAVYLPAFLFGFGIAKHAPFFEACMRWRWLALAVALAAWAMLQGAYQIYSDANLPPDWLRVIMRGVREAQAWAAILACFGFAYRHLRDADGPVRRYFTEAIFPYYLIHQTIIVVLAFHLNALNWPLAIEAAVLVAATFAGCALFYEIARRSGPLRVWFGLKPRQRAKQRLAADPAAEAG
ncbi:MAG: acyltransferase [Hyphomonadaceae bacterium]